MTYNVPLSSLFGSDGNVTYSQNTILKVGQGSNITVASSLYESNGNVSIGTSGIGYAQNGRTSVTINGTSQSLITLLAGGTAKSYLYTDGTNTALVAQTGALYLQSLGASSLVFTTNSIDRAVIDSNGNVGIATTTPTSGFKLDTNGNLRVNGNIVATSEITAYFSDVRLKSNVTPITNAVNLVMAINGVYYNPNDIAVRLAGENHQSHKVGLLAQEVEKVLPQIIRHAPFDIGDNGISKSGEYYKTIQYERIVPLLVEAIKEQTSMIQDQDKRITVLEEKLKDLSNLINTNGRL